MGDAWTTFDKKGNMSPRATASLGPTPCPLFPRIRAVPAVLGGAVCVIEEERQLKLTVECDEETLTLLLSTLL